MRDKHLMHLVLGLNLALAGAAALYFLTTYPRQRPVAPATFITPAKPAESNAPSPIPTHAAPRLAPAPAPVPAPAPAPAPSAASAPAATNESPGRLALEGGLPARLPYVSRTITWKDVQSPEYRTYMENLQRAGCPKATVRRIALDDINALFAHRRLKIAEQHDPPWWRPEAYYTMSALPRVLQEHAAQLDAERRDLITRLLDAETAQAEKQDLVFWTDAQLTGTVLGRLSPERHAAVQAACRESLERFNAATDPAAHPGEIANAVDLARLRDQTRLALRRILTEEEMFEFLVRYSANAARLRDELRDFNPTADEFRSIFRATDAVDHALQLECGGPDALSTNQRERWQRQRREAIREALSPERHADYVRSKDPLYRQALLYATQYGAPPQAVPLIYDMTRLLEHRRQDIVGNPNLSAQEKSQALQSVNLEQQKRIQAIVRQVHERAQAAPPASSPAPATP
ncbi:MAG: hypothetical protein JXQ71_02895 [Verrucomicrobia bacterium]|nr:hypothetical protein [Verrucomicrobiota bacterium]